MIVVETILLVIVSVGVAATFVLYAKAAALNLRLTERYRDRFYRDAEHLLDSGEMPEWAEDILLGIARRLWSRRTLYHFVLVARMVARNETLLTPAEHADLEKREALIPKHLRPIWDRALGMSVYAQTGAEPFMGATVRALIGVKERQNNDHSELVAQTELLQQRIAMAV